MKRRPRARTAGAAVVALAVCVVAAGHMLFGLGNFRPGYPVGEGVTALMAGFALLIALGMARRSLFAALVTAFLGTMPLSAWFAFAVPAQGSSTATLLWLSLIVPVITGVGALVVRRRVNARRRR